MPFDHHVPTIPRGPPVAQYRIPDLANTHTYYSTPIRSDFLHAGANGR
jgi:hypothetical protein